MRGIVRKKTGEAPKPLTAARRGKRDQKRHARLRAGVQLAFFLLAPALFTSAFTGLKQIFTAIGDGQPLEFSNFARVLLLLCLFTMAFGRFFCGYACAFGALGDFVYALRSSVEKWTKRRFPHLPKKLLNRLNFLPFLNLTVIVGLCAAGLYNRLSGWSPWDVFSMLTKLKLRLDHYGIGGILLLLILAGMALEPRFFCRFLCPLGGVFRLLPIFPWAGLKRDTDNCVRGCSVCAAGCPVGHRLGTSENAGACIRCDQCLRVCPRQNIRSAVGNQPGVNALLTLGKAGLLLFIAALLDAVRIF